MSDKVKGIVKWFNNRLGYGFLTTEEGKDVFVHYSGIGGEGYKVLYKDDKVEFEIVDGQKGKQAANVIKTSSAEPTEKK